MNKLTQVIMKKFYYIYKITLLQGSLKNHYYYGQHSTDNLDDGYAGSGAIIRKYYRKYRAIEGETYLKEIIQTFSSKEELNSAEQHLIGDLYESDPLCINLRAGGNQPGFSKESLMKRSKALKGRISPRKGMKTSEETKKKLSENHRGGVIHHSEETRRKMSCIKKGKAPSNLCIQRSVECHKGHKPSEETRRKMSEAHKNKTPWNKGKSGYKVGKYSRHISAEEYSKRLSNIRRGRKRMSKESRRIFVPEKDIQKYLSEGWKLG